MAAQILVAFGLSWMSVSALIGLYLGAKHEIHINHLAAAASDANLLEYHKIFEQYKWRASVHGHGMLFSLSSIVVGLVLSEWLAKFSLLATEVVAGALMLATVTWTLAALWRIRLLMGIADLVLIGILVATAVRLLFGQ